MLEKRRTELQQTREELAEKEERLQRARQIKEELVEIGVRPRERELARLAETKAVFNENVNEIDAILR